MESNSTTEPGSTQKNIQAIEPLPDMSNRSVLRQDLDTMIHFAAKRGIPLPSTISLSKMDEDNTLVADYNVMIEAVKPATVQSINYISNQILGHSGEDKKWYQTPIISKCLIISVISLLTLISISLSPEVNSENQAAGLLSSQGMILFYNLIFICSASLLGVMFYLLKTISDKIKNYTLLPVDAIEVNATILIGVISGFIISELFTFSAGAMGASLETQKMTLALLGGFSSDAMFSVLKGVVNKLKALFSSTTEAA